VSQGKRREKGSNRKRPGQPVGCPREGKERKERKEDERPSQPVGCPMKEGKGEKKRKGGPS